MLIKYNANEEIEWAKSIGGTGSDYINAIDECNDGGYIAVGIFFSSEIELENGEKLNNVKAYGSNSSDHLCDAMIIKYTSEGQMEWASSIGGKDSDYINSIKACSDGGYIIGGYFKSNSIDLGNGVTLTSNGEYDGIIVKYNANREVEWSKVIGGTSDDYISALTECNDGGYLAVGSFKSSSIDLGNKITLSNKGTRNGMIIKYNANGKCEWSKAIGGTGSDYIRSVIEMTDGNYLIAGNFNSKSIELENGTVLTNKGNQDGMIIKCTDKGEIKWSKTIGGTGEDCLRSVSECRDGGYIVGVTTDWRGLELENNIRLEYGGIVKYDANGEAEWSRGRIEDNYYIISVERDDGSYLVVGTFYGTLNMR